VAWSDLQIKTINTVLKRAGASYSGSVSSKFDVACHGVPVTANISVHIQGVKAAVVKNKWIITHISGTMTETIPSSLGCVGAGITYSITGSFVSQGGTSA
jgi:hypothetical protein